MFKNVVGTVGRRARCLRKPDYVLDNITWTGQEGRRRGRNYLAGTCIAACSFGSLMIAACDGDENANQDVAENGLKRKNSEGVWHEGHTDPNVHHAIRLARQNTTRKRRNYYKYIIVGAGTTALSAIEGILKEDPDADILMLTDEANLPRIDVYRKETPLPADLLASYNEWRRHVSSRLENEPGAFSSVPITLLLGRKRLRLDVERRALILDDNSEVLFDRCLIATAGRPRRFYVLDSEKSNYYLRDRINILSSLADFQALNLVEEALGAKHVTVIGGGFLGTEVALAMARRGMKVSQVYAECAPLARHLPIYLAEYMRQRLEDHGVQAVSERLITSVSTDEDDTDEGGEGHVINLNLVGWAKERMRTDYLIMASTHVDPVVTVAKYSGLEIDQSNGGIVVNGLLEAVGGIYAAGACASYFEPALGRRRVDMLEHSIESGLTAGYNMAVTQKTAFGDGAVYRTPRLYKHQPAFRSQMDSLDVLCQGVGELDSSVRTVGVWVQGQGSDFTDQISNILPTQYTRGLVYYLRGGKVVGVLVWNAPDLLEKVQEVVNQQPQLSNVNDFKTLVALAPNDWINIVETNSQLDTGWNSN